MMVATTRFLYPVSEAKSNQLENKMRLLGVRPGDLKIVFGRSQGPGGQNVNKVETAVTVCHLPTGLCASSQKGRSQALNRFLAMRLLVDRLGTLKLGWPVPSDEAADKIRRQKNRRRRRSKAY